MLTPFFIRKALTKPLWWIAKNRPYPIRNHIDKNLSVSNNPKSDSALMIMAHPAMVNDATWSAMSFLKSLTSDVRLLFLIDISIIDEHIRLSLSRTFPNCEILSSHNAFVYFAERAPNVVKFARNHPMGRKLLAILSLQEQFHLLYSDSDVLCFRPPDELNNAMLGKKTPAYLRDSSPSPLDQNLFAVARTNNQTLAQDLNGGLLYIPKNTLSIALADQLLKPENYDPTSWFTEQTTISILMQAAGASPLPLERYVVSTKGQFFFEEDENYHEIVVRHFVTPVRHLMYSRGMPILQNRWK